VEMCEMQPWGTRDEVSGSLGNVRKCRPAVEATSVVKVHFTVEQAMKAQRWSRCIAVLFL
jgi:hypothetical protein